MYLRVTSAIRVLGFSALICTALTLLFPTAADAAEFKAVDLKLKDDGAGNLTIVVDPENAPIWRNKQGKAKKVRWVVKSTGGYDQLFWELRYDPDKGGGSGNYFGDVDLACGETQVKVKPDPKPDFPFAQWPYAITVYACVDGAKGEELASVDPRIKWND